ncbi:MAG: hypothetical protein RI911_813 [Candidatus Parcubacteria bacterium]|jgi:hypothetical protein
MNIQVIIAALIGLVIGIMGTFVTFNNDTMHQATPEAAHVHGHDMEHTGIQADTSKPTPSVTIHAQKDSKSGYNIHVQTQHFTFTPERVGESSVQGEGHAHVYVNDKKVMRLYSAWAHIPGDAFQSGENTITVTLNGNDHSDWMLGKEHIEAEATVVH